VLFAGVIVISLENSDISKNNCGKVLATESADEKVKAILLELYEE